MDMHKMENYEIMSDMMQEVQEWLDYMADMAEALAQAPTEEEVNAMAIEDRA